MPARKMVVFITGATTDTRCEPSATHAAARIAGPSLTKPHTLRSRALRSGGDELGSMMLRKRNPFALASAAANKGPLSAAVIVCGDPPRDRVQPSLDPRAPLEASELAVDDDEGFLHRVVEVCGPDAAAQQHVADVWRVGAVNGREVVLRLHRTVRLRSRPRRA